MNNLYEVLDICLQELEQGSDIETVLFRYPDLADELRPILETSVDARKMAVPAPADEVVRRNRSKLLQYAAQMREAKANPSRRIWFASLRRLAVTLAILAVLFASGTGLVRAASTTLPGDNLYPVKRTWEDVLVAFTFNVQERDALEVEHENERLQEMQELFAEGRSAKVDFAGLVTSQKGSEWEVSTVLVVVSTQTEIRDQGQGIGVGSAVRVKGQTQDNSVVLAERIELLPAGAKLPEVPDELEIEQENHEGSNQQSENNSGPGSEGEMPTVEETKSPEPEFEPRNESLNGTVNLMEGNVWDVNGIPMDVSSAEIKGTPSVGASVKVEGYYDANGVFIVKKIEFESSSSGTDNGSDSNDSSNTNSSNDNSGSNSTDDSSNHNGGDDSAGGGSNSGSGGSGGGGND
jgi:uncharacterized membrane protein YgcG